MKLSKRDIGILIVWVLVIVAMIPTAIYYSNYLSYSNQQQAVGQSAVVQNIIANSTLNRDSLIVVVNESPYTSIGKQVLYFQGNVSSLPWVNSTSSAFSDLENFLTSVTHNSTFAKQYVETHGLKGAPQFITSRYVSKDNSTFLIFINMNYSSGFLLKNGESPAQQITPDVEKLANHYFGNKAYVTGTGAIAYDTSVLTQKSGFVFPALFLILVIAIGITFRSLKISLLGLVFIFITTLFGYFAVFVTGVLLKSVDYVVNYTLSAVLVGVTTDYFVFLYYRFRSGKEEDNAVKEIKNASKAVIISGATVAVSLATFSLIKGFLSWGIVLSIAVIISATMMVTLSPVIAKALGKRLLPRNAKTEDFTKSAFYKAASIKRKALVTGLIILIALPSIYFFFNLPTTFDFNSGLPSNLRSVQGLHLLEDKFGEYTSPIIVLAKDNDSLRQDALTILNTTGVTNAIGPYLLGGKIYNQSNISQFKVNGYYYFIVYTNSSAYSQKSFDLISSLRSHGFLVGGLSAAILDTKKDVTTTYSLLELLVTLGVAIVLGISFRSWKYPLISISGVFISITWSTSLLYVISRFILHEQLIYLIPAILYIILISLGSDYSVFIFSTVKDEKKSGNNEYVQIAMAKTGKIVTTLGLILAISLGILSLVPVGFLEQLGIAFLISLILDTFVIRTFYFPAMIRLMERVPSEKSSKV